MHKSFNLWKIVTLKEKRVWNRPVRTRTETGYPRVGPELEVSGTGTNPWPSILNNDRDFQLWFILSFTIVISYKIYIYFQLRFILAFKIVNGLLLNPQIFSIFPSLACKLLPKIEWTHFNDHHVYLFFLYFLIHHLSFFLFE